MSDNPNQIGEVLDHTLDAYLLGLAEGIKEAQSALNQITVPVGAMGQAAVAYHMPKLDFELRLHMNVQTGAAGSPRRLVFRPAAPANANSTMIDVVSTISGSFVSVPLASSQPPARLRTGMKVIAKGVVKIFVTVVDVLGKPLPGTEVHFNLDRDKSIALTLAERPAGSSYTPGQASGVTASAVITDAQGRAESSLKIDPAEAADALLVVRVDIAGASESLLVPAQTGLNYVADR